MNTIKSPPSLPRTDDLEIPSGERKTLRALLPDDCRWPIGDPQTPEFHFCGKRKQDGHPYCEFHMRRAYQPARNRAGYYRPSAAA